MKPIVFISLVSLALSASARTLIVGPETDRIESRFERKCHVGEEEAPDTLLILPRGELPLEIAEYAFWDSPTLKAIEFPDNCKVKICEGAFKECVNLTSVKLPDGCTLDGQYIFSGCTSLSEVRLPDDLRVIPPQSFSYCRSLREVRFPSGLRRVGNNAFSECRSLTEIWLPDSVTELESYAFSECTEIKTARLPANGAMLGELIFSGCRNLECLHEPSREVPVFDCNSYIFEPDEEAVYSKCQLIVPEGMIDAYRSAPGWSLFKQIR